MAEENPHGTKDWRYCAVCAGVLTRRGDDYFHVKADHPAVPVTAAELAEINEKCDICNVPAVSHYWPAKDFYLPDGINRSMGGWSLCPDCAEVASRGRLSALVSRGMTGVRRSGLRTNRKTIEAAYERLLANVTDVPQPKV